MGDYRILVTGSRDWDDERLIFVIMDQVMAPLGRDRPLTLVHGACPKGADRLAGLWAASARRLGWPVTPEPHPADWRPDGVFDKSAGFKRNAAMVSLGADLCLAFIMPCSDERCRIAVEHGSHGATHCADLAEKSGIETRRFTDA
jgi:hypothetical protein